GGLARVAGCNQRLGHWIIPRDGQVPDRLGLAMRGAACRWNLGNWYNTRRPVYVFRNRNTTYTVTYQTNDQDTIRLEVFQGGRRQLNQLLTRVSN
ncbi:MAG: hypothetical protein ACFCA4_12395, partial [Cyanophyceae cyanobacterium]